MMAWRRLQVRRACGRGNRRRGAYMHGSPDLGRNALASAPDRYRNSAGALMAALSILDLVRVTQATDARGALDNARDLAAHAERWGYRRFWIAEHHNMPGIASAATAVVIAHIAAGTRHIRVGAGGIMLPNHAPLVIAEQFGTLARLHPGRIDLGLGRAPGTDQITVRALRRNLDGRRHVPAGRAGAAGLFRPGGARPAGAGGAGGRNRGAALDPRVEHLRRAARRRTRPALRLRLAFRAGAADGGAGDLPQPLQAFGAGRAALRDDRRQRHRRRHRRRGAAPGDDAADVVRQYLPRRAGLEPPADRRHRDLLVADGKGAGAADAGAFDRRFAGDRSRRHRALIDETEADELMIVSDVFDHAARLRSFELIAAAYAPAAITPAREDVA